MRLTYREEVPQQLVDLVASTIYKPEEGVLRVTQLIAPPMMRRLLLDHWDDPEAEVDLDDYLLASLGTAWHQYIAPNPPPRMKITRGKVLISGECDVAEFPVISDHKLTSISAWQYGKDEWMWQLNMYRWLFKETTGQEFTQLQNLILFRNFSKEYQSYNGPPYGFMVKEQDVIPFDRMEQYVNNRLAIHAACFPCTSMDKWCRPGGFAVMEKGKKRATKILLTEQEAIDLIDLVGLKKATIEVRLPKYLRCESYCQARSVCPFAKSLQKEDK